MCRGLVLAPSGRVIILLALLICVAGAGDLVAADLAAGDLVPADGEVRRLAFAGDFMLHQGVKRAAAAARRGLADGRSSNFDGFVAPLVALKPILDDIDLAFVNLEGPLMEPPAGDLFCMTVTGNYRFGAPPSVAGALAWTGFHVVSVANNHIRDQGPEGVVTTVRSLLDAGLVPVGAGTDVDDAEQAVIVSADGLKVAYLAWCSSRIGIDPNAAGALLHVARRDPACPVDRARMGAAVSRARADAELVVVSFHWGPQEYRHRPDPSIIETAHVLAQAGADVIVGHHPHVLHPVEVVRCDDGREALIMYSLGNLLSNQAWSHRWDDPGRDRDAARRRQGAIVRAAFRIPGEGQSGSTGASLIGWDHVSLWTTNNGTAWRAGIEAPRVAILSIDDEMERLHRRLAFLEEQRGIIGRTLQAADDEHTSEFPTTGGPLAP